MIFGSSFWQTATSAEVRAFYGATLPARRAIEAISASLFDEVSFSQKPRPEVTTHELIHIAQRMGARVILMDQPPGMRGAILQDADAGLSYLIRIPASQPVPRLRFTIAHELGHLVVPEIAAAHGLDLTTGATEGTLRWWRARFLTEILANTFAGSLLVPRQVAVPLLWASHWDPQVLVREFGVTYETAAHRVIDLAPVPMHFLKVDADRRILKSYAAYELDFHANVMRVCGYFGAVRAIEEGARCAAGDASDPRFQPTFDQVSTTATPGLEVLCRTRTIDEESQTYAITIGCRLTDAATLSWTAVTASREEIHLNCRAFCRRYREGRCTKVEPKTFDKFDSEVLDWFERTQSPQPDRGEVFLLAEAHDDPVVDALAEALRKEGARVRWQDGTEAQADGSPEVLPNAVIWIMAQDRTDSAVERLARQAYARGEVFLALFGSSGRYDSAPEWLPRDRLIAHDGSPDAQTTAHTVVDRLRGLAW